LRRHLFRETARNHSERRVGAKATLLNNIYELKRA